MILEARPCRGGAADHVTPWCKVQRDDYDFRWIKGASKGLLEAGCIYEYARESRKLRCLLVLMDPKRKREPFEITLSSSGKERYLPPSFEGLGEEDAARTLSGAFYWLRGYTKELAENMSFAELLRVKGDQVKRFEVKRSRSKRLLHFRLLKAVDLAFIHLCSLPEPPPWPWQPWSALLFAREEYSFFSIPERSNPR